MTMQDGIPDSILEGRTVLLVDDEPEVCKVLAQVIGTMGPGLTTVEAHDGRAALDLVAARAPDVIVLDLVMPELDGYTVLDELRAREATRLIPVAVLTGWGDTALEAELYHFGADAYLAKPVSPKRLKAAVFALLRIRWQYDYLTGEFRAAQGRYWRLVEAVESRLGPEVAREMVEALEKTRR